MRIREAGEWGAPSSLPEGRYAYRQETRRRVVRATLRAEAEAARVQSQAAKASGAAGGPDRGAPVEEAHQLWAQRALQQASYVSHMAQEVCNDSTKANWTAWTFREYGRLLDEEMVAICQIYREVELTSLPVRKEKEAREWLTSAHRDAEHAREHIGTRICQN